MRDELLFALQRKSLQVLALRVAARSHLRVEGQGLKALVRGRCYTNSAIIRDGFLLRQASRFNSRASDMRQPFHCVRQRIHFINASALPSLSLAVPAVFAAGMVLRAQRNC